MSSLLKNWFKASEISRSTAQCDRVHKTFIAFNQRDLLNGLGLFDVIVKFDPNDLGIGMVEN
jgi:hypothetical protein